MNNGLTITKEEKMQQIIFELKGFNDYVLLTLKGKAFDNDKLNQLLEYINRPIISSKKIDEMFDELYSLSHYSSKEEFEEKVYEIKQIIGGK